MKAIVFVFVIVVALCAITITAFLVRTLALSVRMRSPRFRPVPGSLLVVAILFCIASGINFIVYLAVLTSHGGSARAGKIDDNKHFVGNHGVYTPVSADVYRRLCIYEAFTSALNDAAFVVLGVVAVYALVLRRRGR